MSKNSIVKLTSLILSVAIIVSQIQSVLVSADSATNTVVPFVDDFESGLDNWETVVFGTPGAAYKDIAIGTEGNGNKYLIPTASGLNNGSQPKISITKIKDSKFDVGRPEKVSFKFKCPNINYYGNASLMLYYDPVTKNYFQMNINTTATNITLRFGDTLNTGMSVSPGGSGANNTITFDPTGWLNATLNYDYTDWATNKFKVTVGLSDNAGTSIFSKAYTYTITSGVSNDFMFGISSNNTAKETLDIDNFSATTLGSYAKLDASSFNTKYANILSKTTSNVTAGNMSELTNAMNEYMSFNYETKKLLVSQKLIMDELYAYLTSIVEPFTSDDFNDFTLSAKMWKTNLLNGGSLTSDYILSTDSGKNVMLPAQGNSAAITTIASKYSTIGKPMTAKYVFSTTGITSWNSSPSLIFYYDSDSGSYAGLRFQGNTTDNSFLLDAYVSDATVLQNSPSLVQGKLIGPNNGPVTYVPASDGYLTVSAEYNYDAWNSNILYIKYTIENTMGFKVVSTIKYTLPSTHSADFKIGVKNATGGNTKFDYIGIGDKFITDDQYISEFNDKFSAIYTMSKSTLTEADKTLISEALEYYFKMSSSARQKASLELTFAALLTKSNAVDLFKTNHSAILALTERTVTPANKSAITAAVSEFDAMIAFDRFYLFSDIFRIKGYLNLLEDYAPAKQVGDLSKFTENFENGLTKWSVKSMDPMGSVADYKIVVDPEDSSNHLLSAEVLNSFLVPDERFWPVKGEMTRVSYRLKADSSSLLVANTSYIDSDNFNLFLGDSYHAHVIGRNEGSQFQKTWMYYNDEFDAFSWLNVEILYNNNTVTIRLTDENGIVKSYNQGGRMSLSDIFALGFSSDFYLKNNVKLLVDDVSVEFKKGDWDIDDTTTKPEIYYEGNTFINPGEIVTISGDNLYDTVKAVQLMRLPDSNLLTPAKYIGEQSYNHLAAEGASAATWVASNAVDVDIVQWTSSSLKFVLPDDGDRGIYVVKLLAKNTPTAEEIAQGIIYDKYIYLNNPSIDFLLADEGKTATKGGWIQIVGSDLVPTNNIEDESVILRNENGVDTELEVTDINPNDNYILKVKVPDSIALGTYQLLVHSKYGDNTAWSQPQKIVIAASPRESWPKQVYNVKNYGAVADGKVNDTAAIITALAAAASAGGGVVYLPEGQYRVTNTLVIPENVVFKGDGPYKTRVGWTANNWVYNKLPKSLITFTENVEISNIGFFGTRHKGFMESYDTGVNENVYIHDLRVTFYEYAGTVTDGVGAVTSAMNATEMRAVINSELSNLNDYYFRMHGGMERSKNSNNFQMYNVNCISDIGLIRGLHMRGNYIRVADCNFDNTGWIGVVADQSCVFENVAVNRSSAVGLTGNFYMGNCTMKDNLSNNREVFTQDGTMRLVDSSMRFVGDNESVVGAGNHNDLTYSFTSNTYANDDLIGFMVFISEGQGAGQLRLITSNTNLFVQNMDDQGRMLFTDKNGVSVYKDELGVYYYSDTNQLYTGIQSELKKSGAVATVFTVDEAFAVSPTRNSKISMHVRRNGSYFVNCTFQNGQGSGSYGTLIDSVFDHCTFAEHTGQVFNLHGGVLWYVSTINGVLKDPYTFMNDGYFADQKLGYYNYMLNNSGIKNATLCNLFKNNQLLQGSSLHLELNQGGLAALTDFVIENNYFEEGAEGISTNAIVKGSSATGVVLYKNTYGTTNLCGSVLNGALNSSGYINKQGSYNFLNLSQEVPVPVKGDINGDGRFSLKDVTSLNYYLVDIMNLTAAQLVVADYNLDGVVNTKDARAMKQALIS